MGIQLTSVNIGSGNDLSPVWHHANSWAHVDQDVSYHIASVGYNELSKELGFQI